MCAGIAAVVEDDAGRRGRRPRARPAAPRPPARSRASAVRSRQRRAPGHPGREPGGEHRWRRGSARRAPPPPSRLAGRPQRRRPRRAPSASPAAVQTVRPSRGRICAVVPHRRVLPRARRVPPLPRDLAAPVGGQPQHARPTLGSRCFSPLPRRPAICFNCSRVAAGADMARIAVVDDERDIREMLVDFLGHAGHAGARGGRRRRRSRRCWPAAPAPTSSCSTSACRAQDGFELARTLRAPPRPPAS